MADIVKENIDVDSREATDALRQGILSQGTSFVERLEKITMMEVSSDDEEIVTRGFEKLSKAVSKGQTNVQSFKLSDLSAFGFTQKHVKTISFCVIRLDSHSPTMSNRKMRSDKRSNHSISLEVTDDSNLEYREDDFEAYDSNADTDVVTTKQPVGNLKQSKIGSSSGDIRSSESHSHSPISPSLRSSSQSGRRAKCPTWILESKWRLGEQIGSGSFGEVFQGMNDKGKLFAVKRLRMSGQADLISLVDEIDLMRRLTHSNIVEYLGAKVDREKSFIYIFQAWIPGGSVAHLLKRFGPFQVEVVRRYTRQILWGLQYLHANNIVHRDIKGGNLLVDDNGIIKLADFGCSKINEFGETQETATIKGTPYFMAPEVLAHNKYGRKGDVWAVGCTIIQMLTGDPPWKDQKVQGLVQLHFLLMNLEGIPPFKAEVSETLRSCMLLCFLKDPEKRPSATDLLTCDFLREEQEDSVDMGEQDADGYMSDASEVSSVNDAQESDDLDNTMIDLRKEILMVEARGRLELAATDIDGEDTFDEIEARIAKKNSRQAHVQGGREQEHVESAANNPFAKRPSAREHGQVDTPVNNPFAKKSAAPGGREQDQVESAVNNPFAKRAATAGGKEGGKRPEHHAHADSSKSHVIQRVSSVPVHNRSESMQQGSSRDSADEDVSAVAAARVDSVSKHSKHQEERTTPRGGMGGGAPHVSPRGGEAGSSAGWDVVAHSLLSGRKPSINQPKAANRESSDSDEDLGPDSETTLRVQATQAQVPSGSQNASRHGSVSSQVSSRKNSATIPVGPLKSSSQQEEVIVAGSQAQKPEATWMCERCKHVNVSVKEDEDACENCATRRVRAAFRAPPAAAKGRSGIHSAQTKPQGQREHKSAGPSSSAGRITAVPVEADKETWDCKFCGETNIEEPEVNYCTFCAKYRQQGGDGFLGLRGAVSRGGKKPNR